MKELKLHELSLDKVKEKGLFWLVVTKDTIDKFSLYDVTTIDEEYRLKEGEIVWCDFEESYKKRIENLSDAIHPFMNNYFQQYHPKDFRELTEEEKDMYLK